MQKTEELKIAFIGGGSRGWARQMITDLALRRGLGGRLSLYDTDYGAARRNAEWGRQVFDHRDARSKLDVGAHRKVGPALKGADFVMIAIQPGPITMMASDIDIPARYGVLQTVGDTAGPGGVVRALRTVPVYTDYAHAVMEHCPAAWVMNFTNPMALCVAALYAAEPDIKAFGYCHEMMHTQRMLAGLVERYLGVPRPDRREIGLDVAGVNHFTLASGARWRGEDLFPMLRRHLAEPGFFRDRTEEARRRKAEGRWFESDGLIASDLLRRFGVLGASGDRHLAEFLPWYLSSEEELHRWGVVMTPSSYRLRSRPDERTGERAEVPKKLEHSGQECVEQMLALRGGGDLAATTNIPNHGQVAAWPEGAVIESAVVFRRDEIAAPVTPPFSTAVNGWQMRIIEQHRLTLRAARERDRDLALQAVLHDPLVQIGTDRAAAMLDEMLRATKAMLPGWKR
jgi:alpha-galactosidase